MAEVGPNANQASKKGPSRPLGDGTRGAERQDVPPPRRRRALALDHGRTVALPVYVNRKPVERVERSHASCRWTRLSGLLSLTTTTPRQPDGGGSIGSRAARPMYAALTPVELVDARCRA